MVREQVERRFGRRDDFDVEALEQRARSELRLRETFVDAVEIAVGGFRSQPLADAEHCIERVVEPDSRGCSPEQVVMRGECLPDRACVPPAARTPGCVVTSRNAEIVQPQALAVQHSEDVVVRGDQQRRRIRERGIVGEPLRVRVPVRTHDRQVLYDRVQAPREIARCDIRGEQAVGVEVHRNGHFVPSIGCRGGDGQASVQVTRQRGSRPVTEERDDVHAHGFAKRMVRDQVSAEHRFDVEKAIGNRTRVSVGLAHDFHEGLRQRILDVDAAALLVVPAGVANPSRGCQREMGEGSACGDAVAHRAKQALRQLLRPVHGDLPRAVRQRRIAKALHQLR